MIRKLQRKFVFAAMLSLLLVLGLLIGLINILNYRTLVKDADATLSMLSELDGNSRGMFTFGDRDLSGPHDGTERDRRREWNGERPYQSRYFSVTVSTWQKRRPRKAVKRVFREITGISACPRIPVRAGSF